jgi:hypothetical protein
MWNKLAYLMLFIFAIGLFWAGQARAADPSLQLWLEFEGNANDSSGNGRNGTLNGAPAYIPGVFGQGLDLNGDPDCVRIVGYRGILGTSAFSASAWVRTTQGGDRVIVAWGGDETSSNEDRIAFRLEAGRLRVEHGAGNLNGKTLLNNGEWHQVAVTHKQNSALDDPTTRLWLDGADDTDTATGDASITNIRDEGFDVTMGRRAHTTSRFLNGDLDDVRMYDRELSAAEIYNLSKRQEPFLLTPADEDTLTSTGVVLRWKLGLYAAAVNGSEVFFGEDFEDVNSGTGDTSKGRTSNVFYGVGGLDQGKVYYWKVDAVNDVHPVGRWSSEVHSFTVPENTSWEPSPPDGAKFIDPDVVLEWKIGMGGILNVVYFGTSFADVNTATGGDPNDKTTYDPPGTLAKESTYYWRIDTIMADMVTTVTGPVWSFTTRGTKPILDPNLVGYWKLDDEDSGVIAIDDSGYDHYGRLRDGAHYAAGYKDQAVEFDGEDDYISMDGYKGIIGRRPLTVTAWVKTSAADTGNIVNWGVQTNGQRVDFRVNLGRLRCEHGGGFVEANTVMNDGQWHHVALTIIAGATATYPGVTLYLDGRDDTIPSADTDTVFNMASGEDFRIGVRGTASPDDRFFEGLIDEVRLYDRVLSGPEIQHLMDPARAYNNSPVDGFIDVPLGTKLTWSAGTEPATGNPYTKHNVYFGTSFDDVNTGTVPTTTLTGIYEYAPVLNYYKWYYWRVDGVGAGGAEKRGWVWSFQAIYNPALVVDPNLLAWYKLDGDATDSSGYGRDLTELGGPTYSAGYDGQAIQLDGVDDYAVYSFLEKEMLAYTVTLWAKADTTGQGEFCSVFSNHTPNNKGFQLDVDGTDPGNYRYHDDFDKLFGPVTTGWVHIAATFDGARTSLFYNGAFVDSNSTVVTDYAFNQYAVGMNRNVGNWFDGAIDDVRIYNRELSDAEIVKVMRGDLARAWSPNPGDGVSGVPRTPILSWKPGDYAPPANGHYVYFGPDDPANMVLAPGQPQTPNNYTPSPLDLGRTYYWAVDEVNTTPPGSVNPGKIWEFTVADHLVLDDMETYDESTDWIFLTWKDGIGNVSCTGGNGTGSALSLLTTGASGSPQAMRYAYDNDGTVTLPCPPNPVEARAYYSKIEVQAADLPSAIGSNWTTGGARALSLRFYGEPNSVLAPMWIELADNIGGKDKMLYGTYADEDTADMNDGAWHEWTVALDDFDGVDETNVKSMAIGIGTEGSGSPGGTGTLYIDDVRLYIPRCFVARRSAEFTKFDYVGDCKVDYRELERMADQWLTGKEAEVAWAPSSTWDDNDIGSTATAGGFIDNGDGSYSVTGSGADIWGTADAFHYMFKPLVGDGQMTVNVVSIAGTSTNEWQKAGVMIRETLAAGSRNVMMLMSAGGASANFGGGDAFQWRPDPNSTSYSSHVVCDNIEVLPPNCVRLVRTGNMFSGFVYVNGEWAQEGQTVTIAMPETVYIGLAVTSHDNNPGIYTTATFNSVCDSSFGGLLPDLTGDDLVNFVDYANLLDRFLDEELWPQ